MSKLNPVDIALTHSEVSASITLQYLYSKQLLIQKWFVIRGYSEGVILYWPMKTEKQKKQKNRKQKTEDKNQVWLLSHIEWW